MKNVREETLGCGAPLRDQLLSSCSVKLKEIEKRVINYVSKLYFFSIEIKLKEDLASHKKRHSLV